MSLQLIAISLRLGWPGSRPWDGNLGASICLDSFPRKLYWESWEVRQEREVIMGAQQVKLLLLLPVMEVRLCWGPLGGSVEHTWAVSKLPSYSSSHQPLLGWTKRALACFWPPPPVRESPKTKSHRCLVQESSGLRARMWDGPADYVQGNLSTLCMLLSSFGKN